LFLCRSFPLPRSSAHRGKGSPRASSATSGERQGKARREVLPCPLHPLWQASQSKCPYTSPRSASDPPLWLASQKAPTRRSALLATSTIPSRDTSQAREVPPFMEPPPRISGGSSGEKPRADPHSTHSFAQGHFSPRREGSEGRWACNPS
jgi:hypothetical protein